MNLADFYIDFKRKDGIISKMSDINQIVGHRIELFCDGKLIVGTSVGKRPENHEEMVSVLKGLIEMITAPDVTDEYKKLLEL